ncbi:MAG: response regulator [Planctomycetota bacterium]
MARRKHPRFPVDINLPAASYEHAGGGKVMRPSHICDISAGGASIIVRGYLHPDSIFRALLPVAGGNMLQLLGLVKWCRYVTRDFHVLGVAWDEPADVRKLVPTEIWLAHAQRSDDVRTAPLSGRVLVLEDDELEYAAIEAVLEPTDLTVVRAVCVGSAVDAVKTQGFDAIVADDSFDGENWMDYSAVLRQEGYKGAMVLLAANKTRLDSLMQAGAEDALPKPIDGEALMAALRRAVRLNSDPLDSTSPITPRELATAVTPQRLEKYLQSVRALASQLDRTVREDDAATARRLCESLHSTGSSYGYDELTEAARIALTALDASMSAEESRIEVRRVARVIERLRGPNADDDDFTMLEARSA